MEKGINVVWWLSEEKENLISMSFLGAFLGTPLTASSQRSLSENMSVCKSDTGTKGSPRLTGQTSQIYEMAFPSKDSELNALSAHGTFRHRAMPSRNVALQWHMSPMHPSNGHPHPGWPERRMILLKRGEESASSMLSQPGAEVVAGRYSTTNFHPDTTSDTVLTAQATCHHPGPTS
jgi:hypothetical protein